MRESLDSIYCYYFNDLYRFLLSLSHNHHTAEDLVQETFLRAHLYVETYKDESIKSWLFTVAHNVFIDYHRKQKRMELKKDSFFSRLFDKRQTLDDRLILDEEIAGIIEMVRDLPEKQQRAVLLHDFHDLTYAEGAAVMNVSFANFKISLYRGRQVIRKKKGVTERNE